MGPAYATIKAGDSPLLQYLDSDDEGPEKSDNFR